MNYTHVEHVVIALAIQLILLLFFSAKSAGAIAVAVFLGREIAQHEYRLAVHRGWEWGETLPVGLLEGVWRGWTLDSVLDVTLPAIACFFAAMAIDSLRKKTIK